MVKNVMTVILSIALAGFTVFAIAIFQSRQEDLDIIGATLNFIPSVGVKTIWSHDLINKGFLCIELN